MLPVEPLPVVLPGVLPGVLPLVEPPDVLPELPPAGGVELLLPAAPPVLPLAPPALPASLPVPPAVPPEVPPLALGELPAAPLLLVSPVVPVLPVLPLAGGVVPLDAPAADESLLELLPALGGVLPVLPAPPAVPPVLPAAPELLVLPSPPAVPASFLLQAPRVNVATSAASNTEYFMLDPLKKYSCSLKYRKYTTNWRKTESVSAEGGLDKSQTVMCFIQY